MHKNAMKCNKTLSKWCKNKHGASKIIDTFETYQPSRHQAAAPAVAPRTQVVEPINGELWHGLAQNRVDSARARRDARRFEEEAELEAFGNSRHGLFGAECFSFLIRSTPLPKGIKLSDGVVKFNG
jgi:hypothetical protein